MITLSKDTGEELSWELSPPELSGNLLGEDNSIENTLILTYENLSIEIITSQESVKETYILPDKTLISNNRLLLVVDTNQTISPDCNNWQTVGLSLKVLFGNVWRFEFLEISDDAGNTTIGEYDILPDGNIEIVIPQDFMDIAVGKIHIDPYVSVVGTSLDYASYTGFQKNTNNETERCIVGKVGSTPYILISSTPTTPSWTNEYSSSPFTSAFDLNILKIVTLLDGTMVFVIHDVGAIGDGLYCCKRTAAGVWDSSLTEIVTGFSYAIWRYDFEVRVVDDGNTIAIIYYKNDTDQFKLIMSTDGGVTWSAKADPSIGGVNTYKGYGVVASHIDTDKFYFFANDGNTTIEYMEYSISSNTWGSAQTVYNNTRNRYHVSLNVWMDDDGYFHLGIFPNGSNAYKNYWSNYSGSWVNYGYPGDSQNQISIMSNAGNYGVMYTPGAATAQAGDIVFWDRTTAAWLTAETPGDGYAMSTHGSRIVGWDVDLWWSENDKDGGTNYVYLTDKSMPFSTSADTAPPTGVAITSPTNGGTNIALNVTLTASAGTDDTPPIFYYFQIDTVNTFDSVNLQESGWQNADYTWLPSTLLSANTLYYMRVKAKDSADPANEGSYTATQSFTTGGWASHIMRAGIREPLRGGMR